MLHSSSHASQLSSPTSKLSSPTRPYPIHGHMVPTKASVKEVPIHVTNAQKMGAALNAKLKSKSRKNHTMPVVKVERMEVKRVSQHYEPVTKSHSVSNGSVGRDHVTDHDTVTSCMTSTSNTTSVFSKKSSAQEIDAIPHKLSSPKKEAIEVADEEINLESINISNRPTAFLTITTTSVSTCMSFAATTTVAVVHSSSKSSVSVKDSPPKVTSSTSNWTNIGSVGSLGPSGRASFGGLKLGSLSSTPLNKSHSVSSSFVHRRIGSSSLTQLSVPSSHSNSSKANKSHSLSSLTESFSNTSLKVKPSSPMSSDSAPLLSASMKNTSNADQSLSSDSGTSLNSQSNSSLNSTGGSSLNCSDDSLKSPSQSYLCSQSDGSLTSSPSGSSLSGGLSRKSSKSSSKPDKLIPCKGKLLCIYYVDHEWLNTLKCTYGTSNDRFSFSWFYRAQSKRCYRH